MVFPQAWVRLRSFLQRRSLLARLQIAATRLYRCTPHREALHPFDLQHGVDTGGVLHADRLRSGHAHDRHTAGYFGSQPSAFRAAIHCWLTIAAREGHTLEDFAFIDIGCGKGRIVMLASEFAFHRVVGIDLNPRMVAKARKNLRRWSRSLHACSRACQDISVLHRDVLGFSLPDTPALLYLYHPFEGELFAAWTRMLLASAQDRTCPLYLAYMNPVHEDCLLSVPGPTLLWSGDIPFSAEEAAAHLFGGACERFALYRLTAPSSTEPALRPETLRN